MEQVHEVVHKEAVKLDGDQIWAQLAWALFLVNFILWLCVQVILRKIRLSAVFFLFPGVFLMLSNGNRWYEQLSAYCVGGKVWKCVDYVEALFSPDFIVPTDEQFQHGGRSDRQEQAMELVQAMALVSWHVDRLQEHVERDMEARGVWRYWGVRSSLCQPRRGYIGCNSSGVPEDMVVMGHSTRCSTRCRSTRC